MKSPLIALCSLAMIASVSAGPQADQFAKFDADHDGKLSVAELALAPWAAVLEGADVDHDGQITAEEALDRLGRDSAVALRQALPTAEALVESFQKRDQNHDGALTVAELGKLNWLIKMDRDEDGLLTLPEIRLAMSKLHDPWPTAPTADAPPALELTLTKQAPQRVKPSDYGIGRRIDLASSWKTSPTPAATVLALVSPSCPVGKRYLPTLARLESTYAAKGVAFHFLAVNPTDDLTQLGLKGTVHTENLDKLFADLGVKSSAEVFVLDAAQTLIYRGAIDDQYGLNYSKESPSDAYLTAALDAVLAKKSPAIAATLAPGCALDVPASESKTVLTYHRHISRLLQANCLECHRTGGVAPFRLETYAQVKAKSGMIRQVVTDGIMPPWGAHLAAGQVSPWKNDRALTEHDRQGLLAWLEAGLPEGELADAPLPRSWPDAWMIGMPEKIYQIPEPIQVKAEGVMPYKNVRMDTEITQDQWVRAWEVQPTAREVVHHVLVFVVPPTGRAKTNGQEGSEEYLAAFVPGSNYVTYPDGFGKFLPAGSKLHFQIHYTPNGQATQDQVRVGLIFAPAHPEHEVKVIGISNPRLRIPAGATHHPEFATIPVPAPVRLIGLMPHMHVRGQSFRYELALPGGELRTLLDVPRYDFNWQHAYRYTVPPLIPAGAQIKAIGWYDNSTGNPANPDPTKEVKWGEQTTDEMMIGYVEYYQEAVN